jgi:DNA-binding CsgD family transcriptional regulator
VAVIVVDDERRLLHASADACGMLGIEVDDVTAKRIDDFVPCRLTLELAWQVFWAHGTMVSSQAVVGQHGIRRIPFVAVRDVVPGRHVSVLMPGPLAVRDYQPLTQREREVVGLLAIGATSPEIVSHLGLAYDTVQSHIRNARGRLGARNRAHLVSLAIAHGEIDLRRLLAWPGAGPGGGGDEASSCDA